MSTSVAALADLNRPDMPAGSGATQEAYDLTRRRVQTYKGDWDAWLNEVENQIETEERYFDEIKYREGVRNQLYYEGQFFWKFSEQTSEVRDLPHTDVDPFFPHNWFRYFTDLSVASAMEASPDIKIDPTRDDDHNIRAAKAAKHLGDYLERELITEEFRLETEKTRQLYGGVWWYSYWSLDAGKLFAKRPVFQASSQKLGGDAFICGSCGDMGPTERLFPTVLGASCPTCLRSSQLSTLRSPEIEVQEIVGHQEIPLGFPCVDCVSPLQMKGDRRGHYMKGQYLRRKRLVDRDVIAERIHWWDSARGGSSGDDAGIRAEEVARRPYMAGMSNISTAAFGAHDRNANDVVVSQLWLQPSKYAHVQFDHDIEFIGEQCTPVPAYTPLGEVFKDGLYALKVGGRWLDHRGENFRKKWVYIPYIYVPNKSDGDSLKDMCEPQREIIHMRSLLYLYLLARSGGAPTIIKPPLSETDFDGSPQTITRLPAGFTGNLQELFFQPQFPPADQNLMGYANQMTGEMQVMSQTVSPTTTGDPNAQEMGGTNTARGMMIMNAKAQGLQGPKLMPLAFGQAQAVMQWIDLYRENVVDDVPIPLKGKTGTAEWKMINASDLEGDFLAYPRAGSWIPRPREERQAALQNAFSVFGEVLMNPEAPPDLKREIKEAYGLEFDLDDYDKETREMMLRIDKMKTLIPQAVELAQQLDAHGMIQPDPQTNQPPDPTQIIGQLLAQMCPPDEDLDEPPAIMVYLKYLKDWLQGDEGKEAPPELQAGVRTLRKMYTAMIQQAQQQQMQQQQDMMNQQQQQQIQAQQQQEQQRQQAQSQMEQQRHANKIQEQGLNHSMDQQKRASESNNRLKEKIAEKSLEAAMAEGQELPVHGKAMVPRLSDLAAQPAF